MGLRAYCKGTFYELKTSQKHDEWQNKRQDTKYVGGGGGGPIKNGLASGQNW